MKSKQKTIYIIGAGWYGVQTALDLAKDGQYQVILIEKNPSLFSELSGQCGVRLHQGPHYPRSEKTRLACREGYDKFKSEYPNLIVEHEYSIYGVSKEKDAFNAESKVSSQVFSDMLASEYPESAPIPAEKLNNLGYSGLAMAQQIKEASIKGGSELDAFFAEKLKEAGVEIRYNTKVDELIPENNQVKVRIGDTIEIGDHVVNATSFQALLPPQDEPYPFGMQVKYQACMILLYKDKSPTSDKPFSFIAMDGAYPCIMPYGYGRLSHSEKSPLYMLTQGKYSILGSKNTPKETYELIEKFNALPKTMQEKYFEQFEDSISLFLPHFNTRFEYYDYKIFNLAKVQSNTEFRTTVAFSREGITYIFPGKINDIHTISKDVKAIIEEKNIARKGTYIYHKGSFLDEAKEELQEPITNAYFNTGNVQALEEFLTLYQSRTFTAPNQRLFQGIYTQKNDDSISSPKFKP